MIGLILSAAGGWVYLRKRAAAKARAAQTPAPVPPSAAGDMPSDGASTPARFAPLPNSAVLPPPPAPAPLVLDDTTPQPVRPQYATTLLYPPYQVQGFVGPGAPGPGTEES